MYIYSMTTFIITSFFTCMKFRDLCHCLKKHQGLTISPERQSCCTKFLAFEQLDEALIRDGYKVNTLMNSRGGVCATTLRVAFPRLLLLVLVVDEIVSRYVANPPPTEWGMTPKDIVGGGVCGTETQML